MNRYCLIAFGTGTKLAVQDSATTVSVLRFDPWLRVPPGASRYYSRARDLAALTIRYYWPASYVPSRADVQHARYQVKYGAVDLGSAPTVAAIATSAPRTFGDLLARRPTPLFGRARVCSFCKFSLLMLWKYSTRHYVCRSCAIDRSAVVLPSVVARQAEECRLRASRDRAAAARSLLEPSVAA